MFRLLLSHLQTLLKCRYRLTMFIVHPGILNGYIRKCTCCKITMSIDFIIYIIPQSLIYRVFDNVLLDYKHL